MKTEQRPGRLKALLLSCAAVMLLSGCSDSGPDSALYQKRCASCHGRTGEGMRALYPPLKGSLYLDEKINELPCLIRAGVRGTIVTGKQTRNVRMPGFPELTIEEMSSLINYLRQRWGKGGTAVSEQTVNQWLGSCP